LCLRQSTAHHQQIQQRDSDKMHLVQVLAHQWPLVLESRSQPVEAQELVFKDPRLVSEDQAFQALASQAPHSVDSQAEEDHQADSHQLAFHPAVAHQGSVARQASNLLQVVADSPQVDSQAGRWKLGTTMAKESRKLSLDHVLQQNQRRRRYHPRTSHTLRAAERSIVGRSTWLSAVAECTSSRSAARWGETKLHEALATALAVV
jgi:hypothetical protein